MKRVEFKLTMPNVGSWNGKWTGEKYNHVVYKNLTNKEVEFLKLPENGCHLGYYHRWDDGWGASVQVRILKRGERKQKSAGFCGYEWMVDNIINNGSTYNKEDI